MRLHLIISRHGLPATRILWTTTSPTSAFGGYGQRAAPASAISSSRTPSIAFANGGYTIAQLLEDVNEVVPLETEPSVFDPEFSGQWGLEDYAVEVNGSECLHFMEVEGLLRDGDEVVIRALQLADLRARRLCGRHQITADGKHLIDGVPFGLPFLSRAHSTRPTITIPPRKKRRTVFSGWETDQGYGREYVHNDEEGDGEWLPPGDTGFGKELSILPVDQEVSDMGTVIRHPVDHDMYSESDGEEEPEPEENELESELKALKEDFEEPASQFIDIRAQTQANGPSLRSASTQKRPSSSDTLRRGSLVGASSLSSKRSRADDPSPRSSKAVRFNKGDENLPKPAQSVSSAESSESESSAVSSSGSDQSSDEAEADSDDDSDDDSDVDSDSDSEASSSESDEEEASPPSKKARASTMNPPGMGSVRTKKSNNRYKLRRRLSKLKEVGVLPAKADFAALRAWEQENGGWHFPDESSIMSSTNATSRKEQERLDFEAKRQKLLRDLESGGVNVEETSEKENDPPRSSAPAEPVHEETAENEELEAESSKRRTLDIASSRRLLFGSLGMRTPKTKADEEATRRKLAAQFDTAHSRRQTAEKQTFEEQVAPEEDENEVNWQDKLDIKATECVFDDLALSAPPFPFVQRWDDDADALIRQRKGWGKKRKRKQRLQVYDGGDEGEYEDENDGYEGNMVLNWDDEWPAAEDEPAETHAGVHEPVKDLPALPSDISTLADLAEDQFKIGAIIAFRQLDMSKATNWQPQMSEYRVAEVHDILENGNISVRLAIRDRVPKEETEGFENDEPRQYAGFEMPGFDEEEAEDDGFRGLAFAELSEPKLLQAAPSTVDETETRDQGNAQEDSLVSVIQDSMANVQSGLPPVDMDLDETTFVTLVTAASRHASPNATPRVSDVTSLQTPGGVRLPQTQGQDADDEHSDTPAIPSPSFSGFHSAQSSPGVRIGAGFNEDANLDGHTLVGEPPSVLVDNSNQDMSALSFLSANQSISENAPESNQQDRQVVDDPLPGPSTGSGSGADSLLSVVHNPDRQGSAKSSPARSIDAQAEVPTDTPQGWGDFMAMLKSGQTSRDNTDQDKDEAGHGARPGEEEHDSPLHSEESLHLPPDSSPPQSSSESRKTSISGQKEPPSQSPKPESGSPNAAQPTGFVLSQASEIIDLTDSAGLTMSSQGPPKRDGGASKSPSRKGPSTINRVQRTANARASPQPAKKKSKRQSWRRF
ncbi:hypothetical protein N7492_004043 [Penicillium capsulatum]|uniref:DUF7357 domain-containing protein n=1 Tax=Penicillium capsulatum TaxID=69766 RepID=A0A9W9LWT0_9EURO|nr:hypothetical protein N7492_004043 [Penicillium capsulatum]KAJ6121383.1 hypothetical protein N7512_003848 [Penicillium capsulatum]